MTDANATASPPVASASGQSAIAHGAPPAVLDGTVNHANGGESSESDGGNVSESGRKEPFANLKLDERHCEDDKRRSERRANLVMGPPLGESEPHANGDQVVEGQEIAANEDLLTNYPDDSVDLELTHLRIRTLRGLGLERFTKVQVCPRRVQGKRHID